MSEIKLRAKRKNTDDWLLFGITELFHGENGSFQVCVEDVGFFSIYPATIQLADDPRKQMLDEIRAALLDTWLIIGISENELGYEKNQVDSLISEMGSKL